MASLLTRTEAARLKAATLMAVRSTPQGNSHALDGVLSCTGRTLRGYCDHADEHFVPVQVVAEIERLAADPIITRVLASLAGYDLAPRADAVPACHPMKTVGDIADAASAYAGAMADGRMSRREAASALPTITRAIEALQGVRANMQEALS